MPAPRSVTRGSDGTFLMLGTYYIILTSKPYSTLRSDIAMSSSQCQGTVAPINATYLISCDIYASQQWYNGSYTYQNFQLSPAPTMVTNPAIPVLTQKRKPLIAGLSVSSVALFVSLSIAVTWMYFVWSELPIVIAQKRREYWKKMLASDAAFDDLHEGIVSSVLLQRVAELRKERGPYISGNVYHYYTSLHGPSTDAGLLLNIVIH